MSNILISILFTFSLFNLFGFDDNDQGQVNNHNNRSINKELAKEGEQLPSATINNIEIYSNSLKVNYDLSDPSEYILNTSEYAPQIRLYSNDQLIKSVKAEIGVSQEIIFDNLKSNTDYKVMVSIPYDIDQNGVDNASPYEIASQTVKTYKQVPITSFSADPINIGYSSLKIKYSFSDIDQTIIGDTELIVYEGKDEIYKQNIIQGDNQEFCIDNLAPNTVYTFLISGQYDIGDGKKYNNILAQTKFKTSNIKQKPVGTLYSQTEDDIEKRTIVTDHEIILNYSLVDQDNTLINDNNVKPMITIFEGDSIVQEVSAETSDISQVSFIDLKADTEYEIQLSAQYDLNVDGVADNIDPYILATNTFKTNKEKPVAKIISETDDQTGTVITDQSIDVNYDLIDEAGILINTPTIEVYTNGELIESTNIEVGLDQTYLFDELQPETLYVIQIVGEYDDDGDSVVDNTPDSILTTQSFYTKETPKIVPTATINSESDIPPTIVGSDLISVSYSVQDPSEVLMSDTEIAIYDTTGDEVESTTVNAGETQAYLFDGLNKLTQYTVKIIGKYDLDGDDEADNSAPYILAENTFTTIDDQHDVETCDDLEKVGKSYKTGEDNEYVYVGLNDDYTVTDDLDCDESSQGEEFEPIGDENHPFTGHIIGGNHVVEGININKPNVNFVAPIVNNAGTISNITISGATIIGGSAVGGVSVVNSGVITDVNIIDSTIESTTGVAGGMVSSTTPDSVISSSSFSGSVSGSVAGGLVGTLSSGQIINSSSTAKVSGDTCVGGLVGSSENDSSTNTNSVIENSYSTGAVSGNYNIGGLVGCNTGNINNSYSTGAVSGIDNIGGLVGSNIGSINNSYATGEVSGNNNIGGLVGKYELLIDNQINHAYATGEVSGELAVGGLVGLIDNTAVVEMPGSFIIDNINNSYTTSNVTATISNAGHIIGDLTKNSKLNVWALNNSAIYGYDNALLNSPTEINDYGNDVSLLELNDPNWYVNSLGFDSNWNVTSQIEAGYHPKLMKKDLTDEVSGQVNNNLPTEV